MGLIGPTDRAAREANSQVVDLLNDITERPEDRGTEEQKTGTTEIAFANPSGGGTGATVDESTTVPSNANPRKYYSMFARYNNGLIPQEPINIEFTADFRANQMNGRTIEINPGINGLFDLRPAIKVNPGEVIETETSNYDQDEISLIVKAAYTEVSE